MTFTKSRIVTSISVAICMLCAFSLNRAGATVKKWESIGIFCDDTYPWEQVLGEMDPDQACTDIENTCSNWQGHDDLVPYDVEDDNGFNDYTCVERL